MTKSRIPPNLPLAPSEGVTRPPLPLRRTRSADSNLAPTSAGFAATRSDHLVPQASNGATDASPARKRRRLQRLQVQLQLPSTVQSATPHLPAARSAGPAVSAAASLTPSSLVELNVGGVHYTASNQTLSLFPGMLRDLVSERWAKNASRDAKGRLFLDLDGPTFGRVLEFLRHRRLPLSLSPERRERLAFLADYLRLDALSAYLEMLECHSRALNNPSLLQHVKAADACYDCGEETAAFKHWHSSYTHLTTYEADAARSAHYAQAVVQRPDCPWRLFHHGINLQPLTPAALEATAALRALAPESALSLYLEAHSYFVLPCPGRDRGHVRGRMKYLCEQALQIEPRLLLAQITEYRSTSSMSTSGVRLQSNLRDFPVPLAACKEMQLATAEKLLEEKKFTEAHAKYTEVLRHFPELSPALFGLAATLRFQGKSSAALETLEKLLAIGPTDPHIHVLHGQLLGDLQRYPEALDALKIYADKKVARWPITNAEFRTEELYLQTNDVAYAVATAHLGLHQWPEAIDALAVQLDNNEIDGLLLAATAYAGMENYDLAGRYLDDCIEQCKKRENPKDTQLTDALLARTEIFVLTGRFREALAAVEEAIRLGSPTLELFTARLRLMQNLRAPAAYIAVAVMEARQYFPDFDEARYDPPAAVQFDV